MTCTYYSNFWIMSDPGRRELLRNYETSGPQNRFADTPRYVRFARWIKAEPPRFPPQPCECGAPDRWRCWAKTSRRQLLGEARPGRAKTAPPYREFAIVL
jgi:hypothetical protein